MADFTLQDLQDQNDLLLSQLEITRANSDEMRDQINIMNKIYGNDKVGLETKLKINQTNRELSNLNKSLVDQLKERNNLERKSENIIKDINASKKISKSLDTEINELIDKASKAKNQRKIDLEAMINTLKDQKLNQENINNALEKELELTNMIGDKMGMIPSIADGISKSLDRIGFGNLSKRLDIDGAISKTKEWLVDNEGNKNKFQIISKFSGELFGNITKTLGPIVLLGATLTMIVKAMSSFDTMTGETAKNFGISYKEASKINQELTQVAATSSNTFITTKSLVEAQNALNTSLGTNTQLSEEMLTTYTELTKQAGYSVESAATLSKLSLVTGKSSKDLTATYLGQVKALNLKNGLAINEKTLLNDISNVSKATLVTFAQNPKELAKAAFEAKKVGLELKQIEGIQSSLLDIESSIGSEFEAEVMTGKALNLERARYYALTNDISGLSQEIANQNITASSFANMNVLQQEAIAKAIGMSREEMGNMLIEQTALSKLGLKDTEENKRRLAMLKERGFSDKAIAEMGKEQLEDQMKSVTVQERFVALTEKLQEVFVSIAGPIMDVVSPLMDLVSAIFYPISKISELFGGWGSAISNVIGPLGGVMKVMKGIAMLAIGYAAYSAFANLATYAPIVGPIMGGIAAASILAAGTSFIGSIKDGAIDPKGGLVVSGPKGSIQLDSEDTFVGNKNGIIAGTNLGGKNQEKQNNTIQSIPEGNISQLSSTLNNKLDQLIGEVRIMTNELKKGMTVNLDGNKVSQNLLVPLAINNRRI